MTSGTVRASGAADRPVRMTILRRLVGPPRAPFWEVRYIRYAATSQVSGWFFVAEGLRVAATRPRWGSGRSRYTPRCRYRFRGSELGCSGVADVAESWGGGGQ